MASAGELHADLMRPSRKKLHFNPGKPAISAEPAVFQLRSFSFRIMRRTHLDDTGLMIFQQPVFKKSLFEFDSTGNDCPILFRGLSFAELLGEPSRSLAGT